MPLSAGHHALLPKRPTLLGLLPVRCSPWATTCCRVGCKALRRSVPTATDAEKSSEQRNATDSGESSTASGSGRRSAQRAHRSQSRAPHVTNDEAPTASTATDSARTSQSSNRREGDKSSSTARANTLEASRTTEAGRQNNRQRQRLDSTQQEQKRTVQTGPNIQAGKEPKPGFKRGVALSIPIAQPGTAPPPPTRLPGLHKSRLAGAAAAGAGVVAAAGVGVAAAAASPATQPASQHHTDATVSQSPAAIRIAEAAAVNLPQDQQFVAELLQRASQLNSAALATVADLLGQYLTGSITVSDGGSVGLYTSYVPPHANPDGAAAGSLQAQQQHADSTSDGTLQDNRHASSAMDVYVSEVEVVNEVVDKLVGIRLPAKAFYGTRAQALAKMTIDECKAQCRLWMSVCGKEYAQLFLEREPRLLTLPPASLLNSLQAISTALALDAPSSVQWALRNSSLVQTQLTLEHLQSRLTELCDVLKVDVAKARQIAGRHTMLLTYAPGDLASRVELLAQLLPVERPRLLSVLASEPQLLTRSPVRVATGLASLAAITHQPLRAAAVMIAAQSGLLGIACSKLSQRWQLLHKIASKHKPWADQLASMAPPQLARCLAASDQAIQRLAFVLNYELQDQPGAQDLKKLLTCSNACFKATLLSDAQKVPRKVGGDKKAWRVSQARRREAAAAADGTDSAVITPQSAPQHFTQQGRSGSEQVNRPDGHAKDQSNGVMTQQVAAVLDVDAWGSSLTAAAPAVTQPAAASRNPAR